MSSAITVQTGWYWDAEFIGFFVADHEARYAAQGLTVQFLEGGAHVAPEQILLSGEADIAITVRDTTLPMIRAGADLQIVGAQYLSDPLAVLVRTSSTITGLHELGGCTIAVPDVSRDSLMAALRRAGVDISTVHTAPYDGSPDILADGDVNAVVGYVTSLPVDLERAGFSTRPFLLAAPNESSSQNLIVVQRSKEPQLRSMIAAWMDASAQGWRLNTADPARYPRELRHAWFAQTTRSIGDEIIHNRLQLEFMGDPESYLRIRSST